MSGFLKVTLAIIWYLVFW